MTLVQYADLIRSLPYLDQAFETKKINWKRQYDHNKTFNTYCLKEFKENTIKLSRNDLFKKGGEDFYGAIVSIIFWGYPRNMRGNNFNNILESIPTLEAALKVNKALTQESFKHICKATESTGVGLSTLSKFLYFFKFRVEDDPCLILDKRIIEILSTGIYKELSALKEITENNKKEHYTEYVKEINKISKAENYKPDQLEFFLFQFGKNLKSEF